MLSLLAALPLIFTQDQAAFEVSPELVDRVGREALDAVEEYFECELDVEIFIVDLQALTEVLYEESRARYQLIHDDAEMAHILAEGTATAFSGTILGKYLLGHREIYVVPSNLHRIAVRLDYPEVENEGVLRAVLLHEAVHAADDQLHDIGERFFALDTEDRFKAFLAVTEGHAQYVAREISRTRGWSEGFDVFTNSLSMEPASNTDANDVLRSIAIRELVGPYLDGERFIRAIVVRGGPEAVERALREPPKDYLSVLEPAWFLDPGQRPKTVFHLTRLLQKVATSFPEEENWIHSQRKVEPRIIEAAFSPLGEEMAKRIATSIKEAESATFSSKEGPFTATFSALEFFTPAQSQSFLRAVEELQRAADAGELGQTDAEIQEATYTRFEDAAFDGYLVRKKIATGGGKSREVTAFVAVDGSMAIEALLVDVEFEPADLEQRLESYFEAARSGDFDDVKPLETSTRSPFEYRIF